MEWILVLVISFGTAPPTVTTIPGHRSKAACAATLENAKRDLGEQLGWSADTIKLAVRQSFCVERAGK